ncbi:hypothetical protein TAMA11512_12980 [Selenomonas sp. TAMA-11512]|uniref:hypothetical protein n=1 Tax=Selenomonas sp. TAMA-11512 TaxID=3095337 RepID=UPI00308932B3|nr:hypothetical protein TAMA11512_12980 [Selenomonas sp. TAMA-11512]
MRRKSYKFLKNKMQNKFLNFFAQLGTIARAADAMGIARQTHYDWMKDDVYKIAFLEAKEQAKDLIEEEAYRRAVLGDDRDIFYKGEKVGTVKSYSDTILALLLKGNFPDKYKERQEVETVGGGGSSITWEGDDDDGATGNAEENHNTV